jgi:prevent-host-death family protein
MAINVVEDIKSVTDLKVHTRQLLQQVRRTGRPMVITVNGRPDVVMIDAAQYEQQKQLLNLAALLAEGERDIREGRTRPAEEFLKELVGAETLPRRHKRKR